MRTDDRDWYEVTNIGIDRGQLSNVAGQAREVLHADKIEVVADRGYDKGEEIVACEETDITVYVPKPLTSNAKAQGRFDKQDFVYEPQEDVYICPAGEHLTYRFTNEERGKVLHSYWTSACKTRTLPPRWRCMYLPAT